MFRLKYLIPIIFIIIYHFTINAKAASLELPDSFIPKAIETHVDYQVFPLSTEIMIGKIKHMVENAPKGAFISIGSERSFRGASMAPNTTDLILLDISDPIIRFNKINRELLKTPRKKNYLFLRWEANFSDWQKHIIDTKNNLSIEVNLTEDDYNWWLENARDLTKTDQPYAEQLNQFGLNKEIATFEKIRNKFVFIQNQVKNNNLILFPNHKDEIKFSEYNDIVSTITNNNLNVNLTKEEWLWWREYIFTSRTQCLNTFIKHPREIVDLWKIIDYKTGNYVIYDNLYKNLHNLAINNKIHVVKIDLNDSSQVFKLVETLKKHKVTLSVLDLDNLYDYIDPEQYREVIELFSNLAKPESKLIVMDLYKQFACVDLQTYFAFTFENVKQWPKYFNMKKFTKSMPEELNILINGRIYEKSEMPPVRFYAN